LSEGTGREIVNAIERLIRRLPRTQERVMIFIDGPNLYGQLRQIRQRVDYFKLVKVLADGRNLIRTYIYVTFNPEDDEEKRKVESFIRALEGGGGFYVKSIPKRKKYINENGVRREIWVEKGTDVALVTDMLTLAYNDAYDTAILVSGDTDFLEAVRAVKARGKKVEVAAFSNAIGEDLKRLADRFWALEWLVDRVRLSREWISLPAQ